jgi:hypothetical protein
MSLAWLTHNVETGVNATFSWLLDYDFVWSNSGNLQVPGTTFVASQIVPADPTSANQISFSQPEPNGGYHFGPTESAEPAGTFSIVQDGTVASYGASVGIGMSGNPTFAIPSQPNVTVTFTPHPVYYIAYGTFEAGQVVDIAQVTCYKEVDFGDNVYTVTATLNADNTWDIS